MGGDGAVLEANDVCNSDAEQRRKQHGGDEEDDDKTHEGGSALGEFGDVFHQFSLIRGVFLDGLLECGEVVFEAAKGTFLLGGVEGESTVIGLEAGYGVLQRLEVHFVQRPVAEQIGGGGDDVALKQGEQFADQRQHRFGRVDGTVKFAGLGCGAC